MLDPKLWPFAVGPEPYMTSRPAVILRNTAFKPKWQEYGIIEGGKPIEVRARTTI